jgi:acyl-CoA synthetase (AMP-forming)/AMP-acid ligase II
MNMGIHLTRAAKWFSDKTAIIHKDRRLTYREFNDRVNRLANGLISLGLEKGDRVALFSPNRHQILEAFYACHKAGLVTVPLNARASPLEVVQMLNNSESNALMLGEEFVQQIEAVRLELPSVRHFISTCRTPPSMTDYETLLKNASSEEPKADVGLDDLVSIEYTSGTTGSLKAAMLTHRNFLSMSRKEAMIPGLDLDGNSVVCHVAPVTHGTIALVLPAIWCGACNLILPGFDVKLLLETVQKEKITHIMLVPTMINFVLAFPELKNYDLSSIRTLLYAASPMPAERVKEAAKAFGPVLIQNYGCHESSALITYLPKEDHMYEGDPRKLRRLASAGVPNMESDVRVVNEQGEDVRPGDVGEIIERGDDTMLGYWRDPQLTAETIVDGWLHTKDMATVDEDGYIYIVDRKSDMIISGGFNVYPFEVEQVLYRHPAVFEAAVIAVPDEQWGESVKAIVVLKKGAGASEEELIEHCRRHLAAYKKPRSVDFVTELPKNAHGKVLRRILRQKYWAGQERMVH